MVEVVRFSLSTLMVSLNRDEVPLAPSQIIAMPMDSTENPPLTATPGGDLVICMSGLEDTMQTGGEGSPSRALRRPREG